MSFFEVEALPRAIGFQRVGGPQFNTGIIGVQSGQEQRNRNWTFARAEYQASVVTPVSAIGSTDTFIEQVRTAFLMVGGMADGFRFYDHLDCIAVNEPMVLVSGSIWQLQKTYSLGGRTYVRTITKPITGTVLDYRGVALADTLTLSTGTVSSADNTTGKITISGAVGTPHASFQYHIPVRLTSDKFEPEVEPSSSGNRVIKWNSLGLIEVLAPNY